MGEKSFILVEGGYELLHTNHYQGQSDLSKALRVSHQEFRRCCSSHAKYLFAALQLVTFRDFSISLLRRHHQ